MPWLPRSTMAATPAIYRARCAFSCSTTSGNERSVEFETFPTHECAEIGAVRHRILPDLVLRPAVRRILAELVDMALGGIGLHRPAPLVVGRHLLLQALLVIAVMMKGDVQSEPGTHDT